MRSTVLHAEAALLPAGWARGVRIAIEDGRITEVAANAAARTGEERVSGALVPGMPNLHSHAFQRAMAGLAESRTHATDSFWTWRDLMYRFAGRITPEQLGAIATHLYVEMLKAGYTSVAEFHYLHHDTGGHVFANPAEMSERIVAAAADSGIALTHLPVLYAYGGFGARPASPAQARFLHDAESYARLLDTLGARHRARPDFRLGIALHSLRAVDEGMIAATLEHRAAAHPACPVHVHIAEQQKEVDDCVAWSGLRPVAWLLEHAEVDPHWCLVHATHLDGAEVGALASSRAVAGLCPTTEANLGDGIFPAEAFLGSGGRLGIGSDSHVDVSAREELRLLEYGQRLLHRRRAVLAGESAWRPQTGLRLYDEAARCGAQALGIPAGAIREGARADLVVLDRELPMLANVPDLQLLDAWIFAGDARCVRDVMVGGRWRVRDRHHPREEELAHAFVRAQRGLLQ